MNGDQELLRDTIHRLLDSAHAASEPWPSSTWDALSEYGMTGASIPQALGGSGGDLSDAATMAFEVGRHAAAVPLPETTLLAGWLCQLAGWEWSGGPETVGLNLVRGSACEWDGDSLVLRGRLPAVPWARAAERVIAVLQGPEGPLLVSLVPGDFSVVEGGNLADEPRDDVLLDDARIPVTRWTAGVVEPDEVCRRGAFMRAVMSAGALTQVADMTVSYAMDRKQFGRSLMQFQAVQQLIARLEGEVFAAVSSASAAVSAESALSVDRRSPEELTFSVVAATLRVARASATAASIAHQVHGAIGTTKEFPLHGWTNRLWCWRNEFGGEAKMSREVARCVQRAGGARKLWELLTSNPSPRELV